MTWAYSPSYGKPLSVPQGVIGLMSRFGMEVSLAYPEGYEVMDDVVELAKKQSAESGGSLTVSHDMKEAFRDADIVYPKSWAPFKAMEERTELYGNGDLEGIKALERRRIAAAGRFLPPPRVLPAAPGPEKRKTVRANAFVPDLEKSNGDEVKFACLGYFVRVS